MKEKNQKRQPETIITSHVNSDFDSLASMLAAQKLYPEAVIIFPGSQEKNVRDFFVSTMSYMFNMVIPENIDFEKVRKLVLVDTRQKKRVPAVAALLDRDDLEIHIYDHHPFQDGDLKGDVEECIPTGAAITILTRLLREKGIPIAPEEATIMAMGIYEDTGSFTYTSTTEADFKEAAFLISCGASIADISDLLVKEIRSDQIIWLNALLNEINCHKINGYDIHISTISSPAYIPDLASIVQKLMKIEEMDVFFAVALMENKIHIVARSRIKEADVGQILSLMNGGGHPSAASAKISDSTLAQVEHELLDIIYKKVHGRDVVREIMSSPPIVVDSMLPCRRAGRILTRYNINAVLVSRGGRHCHGEDKDSAKGDPERVVGFITRQIIDKTLYHKLDDLPVHEYMNTDFEVISTEAGIPEIQSKIIEGKQRILPVVNGHEVIGVITRTDILNFIFPGSKKGTEQEKAGENSMRHAKTRNILSFMKERLKPEIIYLLRDIGLAGDRMGLNVFVVGGFVRDLMLYRKSDDIDIVVEGDGTAFAGYLADIKKGRCNTHPEFGTAVVILPSGFKIDVASARLEYYKSPAALPTVEMSSIKLDLVRRDFTINTLAIRLNSDEFGTLIDFFGGQRDIKDKTIRIIHNVSFVEDPTRVFRAIKFANRFDFTIGKLTANLIRNAIKIDFFKRLSGRRVFSELKQILEEENPISAIALLNEYKLDKVIHPELIFDKNITSMMESVKRALAWHDLLYLDVDYLRWAVYFMVLIKNCPVKAAEDICMKFRLPPKQKNIVLKDRLRADDRLYLLEKNMPCKNSTLHNLLSIFKTEHILYMMATARHEEVRKAISFFYTHLKDISLLIRGKDLMEMGIEPGPVYRDIMHQVLGAKLDGLIQTREDEVDHVKKIQKKAIYSSSEMN
ncbi:MAG: CBS domain-containing protein [Desulfamplus sp.]|nr:CBS domain-containing protein [Desulfamplus sp.]